MSAPATPLGPTICPLEGTDLGFAAFRPTDYDPVDPHIGGSYLTPRDVVVDAAQEAGWEWVGGNIPTSPQDRGPLVVEFFRRREVP